MKKTMMFGLLGAMMTSMSGQSGNFEITSQKPKSPISKNKPSRKRGWCNSPPSEHFGRRSSIVTAYTNKDEFKQMKLKNALKKGFPVSELGQVYAEKDGSVHFSEEFINSKNI